MPEARGLVAVNLDIGLQTVILLVSSNISESMRKAIFEFSHEFIRPFR